MARERKRRQYKTGSIVQRHDHESCPPKGPDGVRPKHSCKGRWVGRFEDGYTATGNRRRTAVYGKTEAEVRTKLTEAQRKRNSDAAPTTVSVRTTVKAWSDTWLELRKRTVRPKPWATDRSAVRQWIVPTIGHKRLEQLTPADMRAVADAQRAAGLSTSTANRTHSTLTSMLRAAILEGHRVPRNVLDVSAPALATNDRTAMSIPEALAALRVASYLPHGSRWAGAFLHGWRQGECLGLTWDCVNLDIGLVSIEWELQSVPYIDKKRPELGYRIPDGLAHRHLIDSYHLLPPKTKKGFRTYQLVPAMVEALTQWREIAPENPWGLVWPTNRPAMDGLPGNVGRPANEKSDREEWHVIQDTVGIRHPSGRYYHPHEIRHTTATELKSIGAADDEVTALMGHSSILTSRGYQHPDQWVSVEVLTSLAGRFGMVTPAMELSAAG